MSSIANDTAADLGGHGIVLARQKPDHITLNGLLEQVQRARGAKQDEILTQIWRLVFRHAYAEETVLWPAMRAALPDGDALTSRVEQEHQEINDLAAALDAAAPDDSDARRVLISRLVTLLRQGVRDEQDVLPRLAHAMSTRQLRRLGLTWETVRRTAPTRPHPGVSRRPPGNALAALPLAVVDHGRDGLDRAARRSSGLPHAAAVTASRSLAAIAGRIERIGALTRGEDASARVRTAVDA